MPLELANEVVIRWSDPDPRYAPLLQEGGITVAWGPTADAFRDACSALGITAVPPTDIQTLKVEELNRATPGVADRGAAGDCGRVSRGEIPMWQARPERSGSTPMAFASPTCARSTPTRRRSWRTSPTPMRVSRRIG